MIERLLAFDPYAWFIAFGVVLCFVCMLAAAGDAYYNHRGSTR